MMPGRRTLAALLAGSIAASAGAGVPAAPRYGLIGKMVAQPGKRAALTAVLVKGIGGMPGCISYIVADDPADPDALWITEVWTSKAAHDASLALPAVKAAIAAGRPLIAAMDSYTETVPVAGTGVTP